MQFFYFTGEETICNIVSKVGKWYGDETQKYTLLTISPVRRMERKNGAKLTEDFTWKIKIYLAFHQLKYLASQNLKCIKINY